MAPLVIPDVYARSPDARCYQSPVKQLEVALHGMLDLQTSSYLFSDSPPVRIDDLLSRAFDIDKLEAQNAVLKIYTSFALTKNDFSRIQHLFYLPEMTADPLPTVEWKGQKCLEYNNTHIPVTDEATQAIVLETGKTLLLQNKEGKALQIVSANPHKKLLPKPALPLSEIEQCVNDTIFAKRCKDACGYPLNMASLPIKGRVLLRSLFQRNLDQAEKLLFTYGPDIVSFFEQFENNEKLSQGVEFLNHLDLLDPQPIPNDTSNKYYLNTARRLVQSISLAQFCAPALSRNDDAIPAETLVQNRLRAQTLELLALHKKQPPLTPNSWGRVALAFDYIVDIPIFIHALNNDLGHQVFLPHYPADFLYQLFDFAADHPEAKAMYETYFELILLQQIFHQGNQIVTDEKGNIHLLKKVYLTMKEEFYRKYCAERQMLKTANTTDLKTDIERIESLVEQAMEEKKHPLPKKNLKVLFGGIERGDRFEGSFCEYFEKKGVSFSRILAVDTQDLQKDFPPNLVEYQQDGVMKFEQANIVSSEFNPKEKFDLIILPWSIMGDIIMKEDVLVVLQKFANMLTPHGRIIFDVAAPVGEMGYVPDMKKQLFQQGVLGIINKEFGGLDSLFNIMLVQEIIMDCLISGLVPGNLPINPHYLRRLLQEAAVPDALWQKHMEGKDKGAQQAIWAGVHNKPRVTICAVKESLEKIQQDLGFPPSFMINLLGGIGELVKAQAENAL